MQTWPSFHQQGGQHINNTLCENQIGFRKKCRTTDHMFVLKCIMDLYKKNKKQLYICFIDFAKCFDRIWHAGLFYKLKLLGIPSRFYSVLKNMYDKISLQVKIGSQLTPAFMSQLGVRQGDNLSPTLFNIFVNDLPHQLNHCSPAKYHDISVSCLLYADDLIILSESKEGMQKALNKLSSYCKSWKLKINMNKSKIMCLNETVNPNIHIDNEYLEHVTEYCYLGVVFTNTVQFHSAIDNLYKKSLKALFKLLHILKPLPSAKTMFHLFDHLIKPIILYACEIWGPCKINIHKSCYNDNYWKQVRTNFPIESKMCNTSNLFEKLHIKLCRCILGVNNKTSNVGIYGELGRYPMYIDIVQQCRRYSIHLENNKENVLLQKIYQTFKKFNTPQTRSPNIYNFNKTISKLCNLDDLSKVTKPSCKRRYREYWECHVHTEYAKSKVGHNKLRSYNKFKKIFKTEPYLINQSLYKYQKILAKFRLSTHRLRIETARYNSKNNYVPPEDRLCPNCHLHKVEDEEHFFIECPKYEEYRKSLFESASELSIHFNDLSNYNKFIWIMSNENVTLIKELGIFLTIASEKQALSYQ